MNQVTAAKVISSTRCASETIPILREENRRLREALDLIDSLDPENKAQGFDRPALVGLINRMGEIARAALSPEAKE